MKLEHKEKPMLFSETTIPDIFFTDYLSSLPGEYVKIYLYLNFLSKYNKDVKINDLSKILSIPYKTVLDGIKYLEENELILKKGTGYIIIDLQEVALNKLYKPNLTLSPEKIEENAKNDSRARAIEHINNAYFQGTMGALWYSQIDMWFNKYRFDDQVMIALLGYCYNQGKMSKGYAQAVADAWESAGVKTWSDLEKYEQEREKIIQINKTIAKRLGKRNGLTQYEEAYIKTWITKYEYGMDVIEIALKRTTFKTNPTFEYLNNIITDWYKRKLRTPKDVEDFLKTRETERKNIKKKTEKQSTKGNYEQRKYDNLDFLYANKEINKKGESNG